MGEVYRTGSNCGGCGEKVTLASGGDEGGKTGSNCGGCERVLGSGGDGRRVHIMWLFLKAMAMRKSVPRVVLRHTIH